MTFVDGADLLLRGVAGLCHSTTSPAGSAPTVTRASGTQLAPGHGCAESGLRISPPRNYEGAGVVDKLALIAGLLQSTKPPTGGEAMGNKLKRQNRMMRVGGAPSTPVAVQFGKGQLAVRSEDGLLINTTQLPTPSQVYDADVAWVDRKHSTVSLFFAKFRYPEREVPQFLSRLEIRYSFEAFRDHFWRNSRVFHESLRKTFETQLASRGGHRVPASSVETEKSASLWANFELLAQTGGEGCVDFYHVNPRSMAIFAQTKDESVVKIDATARILLASVDLLGLLNDCTDLAATLGAKEESDDAR